MLGIQDPDKELLVGGRMTDDLGHTHVRFKQKFAGLNVFGAEVIAQLNRAGDLVSINGSYTRFPSKKFVTTPAFDSAQAVRKARAAIESGTTATTVEPPRLLIWLTEQQPTLAWRVRLQQDAPRRWSVFLDARTGAVLTVLNEVPTESVPASGRDLFGVNRSLNVWLSGGQYSMTDASKPMYLGGDALGVNTPGVIRVLDLNHKELETGPLFNVSAAAPSGPWLADAVSASYNFSAVYDYFMAVHDRNSYDGRGGSMLAVVRYGQDYPNAFYSGHGQMYFGDDVPYAAALDVIAHELGHGVTEQESNLIYEGQSGALNEHFSDVFGEMAEAHDRGGLPDWLKGGQLNPAIGSFANPNSFQLPARMSQFVVMPRTEAGDWGGVHYNSWIFNHAFYLAAAGLPGSIGVRDADRIWYRANTTKLFPSAQFIDARLALIQSADELFGTNSRQSQAVAAALDEVEVYDAMPNPSPGPTPGSSGASDAILFVFFDPGLAEYYLGRLEAELGDQLPFGTTLSTSPVSGDKVGVTEDGSIALFVNAQAQICVQPTDGREPESCFGEGNVWSATISPDGSLVALVFADPIVLSQGSFAPSNTISVIDLGTGSSRTYALAAATPDAGTNRIEVEFADALAIQSSNEFLIYDALNRVTLADGQVLEIWSIYGLNLSTGNTIAILPPQRGLQIGYPSLANRNDFRMTFDVRDELGGGSIYAADLNTGTLQQIAAGLQDWASPAYSGDDGAILYSVVDGTATGYSIWRRPVAVDGVTPVGSPALAMQDADFVAPYRRGTFSPAARIDLALSGGMTGAKLLRGQQSTFTYVIRNDGPETATGVSVTSTVPDSTSLSAAASGNCSSSGSKLVCEFTELQPGQQSSVAVNFTPQVTGPLSIGIAGNANQTDSNSANNTFFITGTVVEPAGSASIGMDRSSATVVESAGSVTFTVRRAGSSSGAVSVNYSTSSSSAIEGSDFTSAAGTLTWADGDATSKSIVVKINNDTIDENDETFVLTLSGPSGGAVLGSNSSATVTVTDDDVSGGGGGGGSGGGGGGAMDWLDLLLLGLLTLAAAMPRSPRVTGLHLHGRSEQRA